MKRLYMKRLKPCFGKQTIFYKENVEKCEECQFRRKCLLEIKGVRNYEGED